MFIDSPLTTYDMLVRKKHNGGNLDEIHQTVGHVFQLGIVDIHLGVDILFFRTKKVQFKVNTPFVVWIVAGDEFFRGVMHTQSTPSINASIIFFTM